MHLASDWLPPGKAQPPLPVGQILPPRLRRPQFPLKDRRTLFTDTEITCARENVAGYPAAKKLADEILQAAEYWVAFSDAELRRIIVTAEVPRAFDCSPAGCPKCGPKIFEVTKSTYPWRLDPRRPFKVQCPVCESVFPSNDYEKFYRSGFADRSDFDGPYVDDGRGWVSPEGERFWFVAHANHWTWFWHPQADNPSLIRGCEALGRAYLLTGDRRYAHTAAVILHRVAEVYPNMDHATQSRQGEIMFRIHQEIYGGKVVNAIWESYMSAQFAETYDAIWETFDDDGELSRATGLDGAGLRGFIEANLLEEIIDAYYTVNTRGNYGMHQRSLLQTALVRQHADNERYVTDVLDKPDGAIFLGLRYALINLVWRDGHPYEVGDYNFAWVSNINLIIGLLGKLGVETVSLPRIGRLLDAPLDSICTGTNTPAIGDSRTVHAGIVGEDADVYQAAWTLLESPRYARLLAGIGAVGAGSFQSFGSLLHPPVPESVLQGQRRHAVQVSRLQSGFGLSLLNNPADTVGLSVYHGLHLNHRHFDRLQLDIFAHGRAMLPDLGYPDAMNTMVPGIFTWSFSTISHNTVTVDAVMQPGNAAGVVELQAEGPWSRVVAVNAAGTYPQCPVYRRTVVMVDTGPGRSYFVDCFEVEGGRQHDYSLHGPPGGFEIKGGDWSEPAPGTLAGPEVRLGEIYDDPALAASGGKNGYMSYRGSGFQHLTRVRRHLSGDWSADYAHEHDPAARLNLRVLPQAGQQLMQAEARVSPIKWPQTLRYFIARRESAEPGLRSKFVSVLEPHTGQSHLVQVRRHDLDHGTAIVVTRDQNRTDVILHGAGGREIQFAWGEQHLRTDARVAVFGFAAGVLVELWWAEGSFATDGTVSHHSESAVQGVITAMDPANQSITLRLDSRPGPAILDGRVIHLGAGGESANTVVAAEESGDEYRLTLRDDLLVGVVRVQAIEAGRLITASRLMLAPTYAGSGLSRADGTPVARVRAAGDNWIELEDPAALSAVPVGEDVRLTQISVGDAARIPLTYAWRR